MGLNHEGREQGSGQKMKAVAAAMLVSEHVFMMPRHMYAYHII